MSDSSTEPQSTGKTRPMSNAQRVGLTFLAANVLVVLLTQTFINFSNGSTWLAVLCGLGCLASLVKIGILWFPTTASAQSKPNPSMAKDD